ncbi:MAG: aspartate aminotransferase family protein [Planctomycetes bacterium]|nr:aspartate aminotransferase family protein [Planctomycetota bacterium]
MKPSANTTSAEYLGFEDVAYDRDWCRADLSQVPNVIVKPPGPKSKKMHDATKRVYKGLSGQVKLFPVCFSEGKGVTLTDVDGNTYLDFSSGIYVTTLGHCHPKISAAVAHWAGRLMNCHDFTTPVKEALMAKLVDVMPGDLNGVQLYDSGTVAVEAGLRICRAATGKTEFLSCFMDFHGKSLGAVSCGRMNGMYASTRMPGFYMLPRPDTYRPLWTRADGTLDTEAYLEFYDKAIVDGTTGQVAAFVLEPIQGWGGTIIPPDDFFPKLRKFCDERKILLMADEVLTGTGRTGQWLCMQNWNVLPDVVALGKGFGNGFPVTACIVREGIKENFEKISASSSYGGNPMACAATLASLQVIEEENLLENARHLGAIALKRMEQMKARHKIIGDVRAKGCLMGIELVKDRKTKAPFDEAGRMVYAKAFERGLAWIPAGHILRLSPPIIMNDDELLKGLNIIDEAIGETEKEMGY